MHGWQEGQDSKFTTKLGKPLTPEQRVEAEIEHLAGQIEVTIEDPWASGGIIHIADQFVVSD